MAPDNVLVIWMDYQEGDSFKEEIQKEEPKFISSPSVDEPIYSTNVQISGSFTVEEAQRLADIINAGSLPVHMTELYSTSVGAQFGEEALKQTIFAGFIGVSIIFLFIIAIYRFPGLIASINLVIYIYLILLVFGLMNGVLTLPGIAALVLGVGMAVDANILTYERIKEELRAGKTVRSSFKSGSKQSLRTILDANITTVIAGVVLFFIGEGAIQGFAVMLIVSIVLSMFTAVLGSRLLLQVLVSSRALDRKPRLFGVKEGEISEL